jgi:hypothetical protein
VFSYYFNVLILKILLLLLLLLLYPKGRKAFHLYIIFAVAAKKTKGKQKMEMKSIENQEVRLVTFSKR